MSRLYFDYTDSSSSLKIIYMAMNFGVKFETILVEVDGIDRTYKGKLTLYPVPDKKLIRKDALIDNPSIRSNKFNIYYSSDLFKLGTIYIHPDSEHIFEPKEGDIGLCSRGVNTTIFDSEDGWVSLINRATSNSIEASKIILRDGKHFFQPLKED